MAILQNVKKRIIVNAGHFDNDPGAVTLVERDEAEKIRDAFVDVMQNKGFEVLVIPDNLDLPQSIAQANKWAGTLNDALCIDIHLNSASNKAVRGVEAFHGTSGTSKDIATALVNAVSLSLGLPNRGARPDTQTAVGSLGWIRQTKAWATLIEVAYISNAEDMAVLTGKDGYKKAALGIARAVHELFGVPFVEKTIEESIEIIESELANIKTQLFKK